MKTTSKIAMTSLCLALLAATPVMAEGNATGKTGAAAPAMDFNKLDADRNGSVSETELRAGGYADADLFRSLDANGDGQLSNAEVTAANSGKGNGTGTGGTTDQNRTNR